MPIDFPNNPAIGNTYPYGNSIWEWTGSSWQLYGSLLPLPTDFTARQNTFTQTQYFTKGISSEGATFTSLVTSQSGFSGPLTQFNTYSQVKAWVTFDGNSTSIGTRRAFYNVSSITDNTGAGDFTINFTTALSSGNYAVATTTTSFALNNNSVNARVLGTQTGLPTTKTTSACRITLANATTRYDMEEIYFVAFH